jgi:hypothetical protein
MNKELVIAAYDRDISWINDLNKDVKVSVYRKGNVRQYENEHIITPHVGRDVHTFFYHIYHNYDNLSDITFFAQDYPFDHWENIVEVINDESLFEKESALNIDGYYGYHWNTITVYTKEKGGGMWTLYQTTHHGNGKIISCDTYGRPQDTTIKMNVDEFWDVFFEGNPPNRYEFIPGGHFGITREHALLRSKNFYKKVLDLLSSDVNSPWVIERLECYIFNPSYKSKL